MIRIVREEKPSRDKHEYRALIILFEHWKHLEGFRACCDSALEKENDELRDLVGQLIGV